MTRNGKQHRRHARSIDWTSPRGFTLIEVLAATTLLACGVLALSGVVLISARAGVAARQSGMAVTLAQAKMEQLRALVWTSDGAAMPVSDWLSDLSRGPGSAEGSGLGVSPSGALAANTAGFCDHVDVLGRWVGAGPAAPASAMWTRRWSIEPLPGASADTLRLEVVVLLARGRLGSDARAERAGGARLISVRARRAQ